MLLGAVRGLHIKYVQIVEVILAIVAAVLNMLPSASNNVYRPGHARFVVLGVCGEAGKRGRIAS